MIPDKELEMCLEYAEKSTSRIAQSEIMTSSVEETQKLLKKEYDLRLLSCLQEKNYAQYLKPDDKSDLLTTKIELRKAEYFKKLESTLLK